jgi:hypothetical protein
MSLSHVNLPVRGFGLGLKNTNNKAISSFTTSQVHMCSIGSYAEH